MFHHNHSFSCQWTTLCVSVCLYGSNGKGRMADEKSIKGDSLDRLNLFLIKSRHCSETNLMNQRSSINCAFYILFYYIIFYFFIELLITKMYPYMIVHIDFKSICLEVCV